MSDAQIEGYARALFEVARADGTLDEVEDELFRFARSYESSDELRNAITDEHVPVEKRQAIVEDLLGGKATSTTVQLVSMVVGSGRGRDLPAIVDSLVQRASTPSSSTSPRSAPPSRSRRPAGPPQGGARERHRQATQPQDRRRPHRGRRRRRHRRRHRHRRQRPHPHRPAEEPALSRRQDRKRDPTWLS
jgi:hypothetical protein